MVDLQQVSTAMEVNKERNLQEAGIHIVNKLVQTEATCYTDKT